MYLPWSKPRTFIFAYNWVYFSFKLKNVKKKKWALFIFLPVTENEVHFYNEDVRDPFVPFFDQNKELYHEFLALFTNKLYCSYSGKL